MASRTQNFVVDIGTDFSANVYAYANGSATAALNLTGYNNANGLVKTSYYTDTIAATINVAVVETTNGIVNLTLDRANTIAMSPGNYVYDVVILDQNTAKKIRLVEGIITATPGIAT